MRALQMESLAPLASPLRGLRVLLWGYSGAGFPGGDGAREAIEVLPEVGIEATYTHETDPTAHEKLARDYDVAIIANTRIGRLLEAPPRLWECAPRRVLSFWDLRPGSVGAPLRGRIDHVFLSFRGPWTAPDGTIYSPAQWAEHLGCPVGYAPQASPLRVPAHVADAPRVLFVGDLANRTYHRGRAELCRALDAQVLNARDRAGRLAIEARLPALYPSARYCLSMSPLAPAYTSVRTYSILACGGLLLLHRFPEAERLFVDGEHAVIFDGVEDLLERLTELDGDAAARARIAADGRRLHARKHTLAQRIVSMLREVTGMAHDFTGWL